MTDVKLEQKYKKLTAKAERQYAKHADLVVKAEKVEAYKNQMEAKGEELPEDFMEKRKKLRGKMSQSKTYANRYAADAEQFAVDNGLKSKDEIEFIDPKPKEEIVEDREAEIKAEADNLTELTRDVPIAEREQLKKKANGFEIPQEIKEKVEEFATEEVKKLTENPEKAAQIVVEHIKEQQKESEPKVEDKPADSCKALESTTVYSWLEEKGDKMISDGHSIRSIAGFLVSKFQKERFLPTIRNVLVMDAVKFYPNNPREQVAYIYNQLES